jgi:hypothetical protein
MRQGFKRATICGAVAVGLAALLTSAPGSASGLAQAAAPPPGWRIVFTHRDPPGHVSAFVGIVATGASDAWAVGASQPAEMPPSAPLAEHWAGASWQPSRLPRGLGPGELDVVAASSRTNVWAFGRFGDNNVDALRWNGRTWSLAHRFSGFVDATGAAVLSPGDVWLFSDDGGTWHLASGRWNRLRLAFSLDIASPSRWPISGPQAAGCLPMASPYRSWRDGTGQHGSCGGRHRSCIMTSIPLSARASTPSRQHRITTCGWWAEPRSRPPTGRLPRRR